jgi:Holliday junction resolvase YEN1
MIYRAADIEADEEVALTLGGFILIGLLSGGDYNEVGWLGALFHIHRSNPS